MTSPRKYQQLSFNAGEISPELQGRIDLDKFAAGVNYAINFIIRDYGGAERRPGFGYVAAVKEHDSPPRLVPFIYNDVQAYIIELGDGYARFYMLGGQIFLLSPHFFLTTLGGDNLITLGGDGLITTHLNPAAAPYEITTPFAYADLGRIQYTSRGDVMWLTHPSYQTQTLERTAHSSWAMEEWASDTGPFLDPNDTAITMTPSVTTVGSTGTLTASAAYFDADMVGAIFRIEETDTNGYSMWEPAKVYAGSAIVRYGNNVYSTAAGGTSGAVAPVHLQGTRFDGQMSTACQWTYLHSGYGVCRVTGFTSTTVVSITVLSRIPSTSAVTNWREGAFSNHRGWPTACCLQGARLWLAGTSYQPQTCWGSVAGNPNDFTPGANADDAVTFTLLAQDANPIRTLAEANKALYVFTASRVFAVSGATGGPIKPDDISVNAVTRKGSNGVQPVNIDRAILFPDQSGKRIQELSFLIDADQDSARNLNKFASHILRPGR